MSLRRRASALLGLSIAVAGVQSFALTNAQAASSTVVINELYINGGSTGAAYTNKYVELRNLTSADINLSGMAIQYRAPTTTGAAGNVAPLTGTIPANGYYVVVGGTNGAVGASVPTTPGQTSTTINPGNAGGTVALIQGGTPVDLSSTAGVIDKVGYGTSNAPEGTATSGNTVVKSLGRAGASTDTDANSVDFAAQDTTPGASNGGSGGGSTSLSVTNPGAKSATVNTAITPFTVTASGGTSPYTYSAAGLPAGLAISPAGTVSGTPTAAGTSNPVVTATDSANPAATATTTFVYTVNEPAAVVSIAQVQGATDTTPYANQAVTTTGVVTASYPTGGLNGFYLQTGGQDTTPDASDGIFVFGGSGLPAAQYPAVGSTVTVSGVAKEFVTNTKNQTEIDIASGTVTVAATPQAAVVKKTTVPGTDCVEGSCNAAAIATAREATESELFAPSGSYTVTDPYDGSPFPSTSSANFGEIGLAANSTVPLLQPTEKYDTQNQAAQIAALTAYNDAHRIILDDASSLNYTLAANTSTPIPWLTGTHYVRAGAAVTFPQPVIMTTGFDGWTFLPSGGQITDDGTGKVDFSQNRPVAPGAVGGDIRLATFNVLNYFPTTGEEFASTAGNSCTYFTDRAGNPVTDNSCNPNGPRGAANAANLKRQQDKIVRAINTLGASIVTLEEIENSVKLGKDRDSGVSTLVAALNADAGAGTWSFAPSPSAANLPDTAAQDVIRTAFIYKPAAVSLVGASKVLVGSTAFTNARQPLAQGFKKAGQPDSRAFAVVVNHFKSKGSGGTGDNADAGQGFYNGDRTRQAQALLSFANDFSTQLNGTGALFLTGDFNAYTQEDPVQVLTAGGFQELESTTTPGEESYNFSGLNGSLDHVFANSAAKALVTGVDIWNINADESVYYEYSRFNYNVTNLYDAGPFRASDHNPEIVGLNAPVTPGTTASTVTVPNTSVVAGNTKDVTVTVAGASGTPTGSVTVTGAGIQPVTGALGASGAATLTLGTASLTPGTYTLTATYNGNATYAASTKTFTLTVTVAPFDLNLLNINDFHGRIDAGITTRLATTIEQLRKAGGEDNTLLLSAGDNIGASLFPSSTQQDDPTIDVLNALEVRTSAVGNHEFDQGFSDLTGHVAGRSNFKYLGANVYLKGTTTPALQQYRVFNVKGVRVGVIGAVTQETASLVSPAGITNLDFGDPIDAVNRVATQLSDGDTTNGEADVLIAEYHEGAPAGEAESTTASPVTLASNLAASPVFSKIVNQTSPLVNAIFTAHTHKRYAYDAPAPAGSDTATRPVVQTGNYGDFVGQVTLSINPTTGAVTAHTERNVARSTTEDLSFPRVAEVKRITDAALAVAAQVGNQPVGKITADITTAFTGGSYVNGKYTVADPKSTTVRDNRVAESTLGDTVANALRDGVSKFATPDLGVTNPGGLRAELLFAGDTASNPANADGVVTYAEANGVLPFNNTVAIVKLTGAQLKTVLEQQYQTAADGSVPTRAYLQLGLSDNVRVTSDPTKAAGSRITSVYINDVALDPAKTYTVSTLSFLATGGDNFRAFTQGSYVDTGLLDAQLFRDFLNATPRSPDFARQQVFESGLPSSITAGTASTFTLGVTNPTLAATTPGTLNMTSLGSPENTSVVASIGGQTLQTFPVTNGAATIALTVPTSYTQAGVVTFTAMPSLTKVTVPFVPAGGTIPPTTTPPTTTPTPPTSPLPVGTSTVAKVKPATIVVRRTKAKMTITVTSASGAPVTGLVKIKIKGEETEQVLVIDGRATYRIGRLSKVGRTKAVVKFVANAAFASSKDTVNIYVKRR